MFRSVKPLEGKERRWKHAAAVAVGDKVFSFGGSEKAGLIDVRIFDTVAESWKELHQISTDDAPCMRHNHTAVLIGNKIYIWGGIVRLPKETYYCQTLYAFDVDEYTWSKPQSSGTAPEEMAGHSACALGNFMYIYGMLTKIDWQRPSCAMYKLDTATMAWSSLKAPKKESLYHSATIIGTKMFVFGGRPNEPEIHFPSKNDDADSKRDYYFLSHFNDIRVFDTKTDCWLPPTDSHQSQLPVLPKGREGHSAFAYNGELYIFGGAGMWGIIALNDFWKFNPDTFTWEKLKPTGDPPSGRFGMCSGMVGARVILSGGSEGSEIETNRCAQEEVTEDVYILDLSL